MENLVDISIIYRIVYYMENLICIIYVIVYYMENLIGIGIIYRFIYNRYNIQMEKIIGILYG